MLNRWWPTFTTRLLVGLTLSALADGQCDPDWVSTFGPEPGADAEVRAVTTYDLGAGPRLFVGGGFQRIGGQAAAYVASWDGTTWSALGTGPTVTSSGGFDTVWSLCGFDDGSGPALYAGVDRVVRWDGTAWTELSGVTASRVMAMAVFDDGSGPALYATGVSLRVNGLLHYIARWDGSSWSSLQDGLSDRAFSLVAYDDGGGEALYVGGVFDLASGVPTSGVARWDGTSWSILGAGPGGGNGIALGVLDHGLGPVLYAGGYWASTDGAGILSWDGSTWDVVTALQDPPEAFTTFDDGTGAKLYATQGLETIAGVETSGVAAWDGTSWSTLGSGLGPASDRVEPHGMALGQFDDGTGPRLVVGGRFQGAGSAPAKNVALWDGTEWSSMAGDETSLDSRVLSLVEFDDGSGPAVHAAGDFKYAGGSYAGNVARWDGHSWSPLGAGFDQLAPFSLTTPIVNALEVYDDGDGEALYAGGLFDTVDGVSANNVACWNGTSWTALGSGINGEVHALCVFDGGDGPELVVGGDFSQAGGALARAVARWDGTSWTNLGEGLQFGERACFALTVHDDGSGSALFVGGRFRDAGGSLARNIARWDGTSWATVGGTFVGITQGHVHALSSFDFGSGPELVLGGTFTGVGSISIPGTHGIARWDGTAWSAIGGGLGGDCFALAVHDAGAGSALYAGGSFDAADAAAQDRVARWDGTAWTGLDEGLGGTVVEAFVSRDEPGGAALYVGGDLVELGTGNHALARWGCPAEVGSAFCNEADGALAACPCGNPGQPESGCDLQQGTGGVHFRVLAQESGAQNRVTAFADGFPPLGNPSAVAIRASSLDAVAPLPFGDGVRCVGTPLVRLGAAPALAGAWTSTFGHGVMAGSGTFYYQLWLRNQPTMFCTPEAFNLSNGVALTWP